MDSATGVMIETGVLMNVIGVLSETGVMIETGVLMNVIGVLSETGVMIETGVLMNVIGVLRTVLSITGVMIVYWLVVMKVVIVVCLI
uniref:Uncharacterized protein n=1 Tax=Meloidogyne javanica TaxID=6303 RepID=A0A915MJZ7_MELJA